MLRLAHQLRYEEFLSASLDEAIAQRDATRCNKNTYKQRSHQKRVKFQERLVAEIAERDGLNAATVAVPLAHREKQRLDARRIKYAGQIFGRRGLAIVSGPDPQNGEDTEYTTKEEIEAECLREAQRRFTQAHNTPFLVSPLKEAAGPIGLNDFMEYVLNHGAFPPDFDDSQVESCVKRLLPYLKWDHYIPEFPCNQTSTYSTGWKKMKSKTSASPYGLTFSQIKAMTLDPRLEHIPAVLGTTPFEYGFSPLPGAKPSLLHSKKKSATSAAVSSGLLASWILSIILATKTSAAI
jgi:hypothetical protein